jgi:hypothetical protein
MIGAAQEIMMPDMKVTLLVALMAVALTCAGASAKSGRALHTDEQVAALRADPGSAANIAGLRAACDYLLKMSDEELWQFVPPPDLPRALNVRFGTGCPVHGTAIFEAGGHYPWKLDPAKPFKVTCPVGGETYPSNDFAAYLKAGRKEKLDTHQRYVDDGYGWINEKGEHFWFVGYYVFWRRWRDEVIPGIGNLARLYLLKGDPEVAHKGCVMLARLAQIYPDMDYRTQAYHNGQWPAGIGGKILDYVWENSTARTFATAVDDLWPALALKDDPALAAWLAERGITDLPDYALTRLVNEDEKAVMDGNIRGNMIFQETLLHCATVHNNHDPARGVTTEQALDWIMWGPGQMGTMLANGVTNDGAGCENTPGYNGMWMTSFYSLADRLTPFGYDLFAFGGGKLKKMADYYLDITVAGKYVPSIGDINGTTNPQSRIWDAGILLRAFDVYHDPRHARALIQLGTPAKALYPNASAAELKRTEAGASELGLVTRSLGGYGLAVLESGSGDNKRAVAMYYGSQGAWHGHKDRLNIEYIAHDRTYMMEMGYPAHWGDKADEWTMGTASHYVVLVDEQGHHGKPAGELHALADSPMVKLMDASAERVYPGIASLYRRTVAMIDVGPRESYLVDIFRVRGGHQHDYDFHGLPDGEMTVDGVALDAPHPGTVAGDNVRFGQRPENYQGSGYYYLSKARYGKPHGPWRAAWRQADGNGLRLWMLDGSCQEVIVADCEPEFKPNAPKEIKYLLARSRGENLESTFAAVIEPSLRRPRIDSVRRMRVTRRGATDDITALEVKLGRRTDEIVSSLNGASCRLETGLRAGAEFAAMSFDHAGVLFAAIANGRSLSHRGAEITCDGPVERHIATIDYSHNEITLDGPLAAASALVGAVVIIGDGKHSTNYTIRSVRQEGRRAVLGFGDVSPLIGMGVIGDIDVRRGTLTTPTDLWGYGGKFKALSMPGMALLNEAHTTAFPITALNGNTFTVGNRRELRNAMTDADGDGRAMFHVCDFKIGDTVRIPANVSVTRKRIGEYEVRATVPAKITLPVGDIRAYLGLPDGGRRPLPAEFAADGLTLKVTPDLLR